MKRAALYSRSVPPRGSEQRPVIARHTQESNANPNHPPQQTTDTHTEQHAAPRVGQRRERALLLGGGVVLASLAFVVASWISAPTDALSSAQLEAAIQRHMDAQRIISPAVRAHQVIAPSVVRVRSLGKDNGTEQDGEGSVGTGVVIIDDGTILTNLHVVVGAERIGLVFANGFESDASIVGIRPEHDLAVLQAREIPDGLVAATMRSTAGLALGERVVTVGFPFGLGPSVTSGVVSGLRREFVSPQGERVLSNLIQFDAAANPGSSGGPLVTSDGEVVGIVTGILNPRKHGVFVGIGFAVPIENAAGAAGVSPF